MSDLVADRGDSNIYDLDLTTTIAGSDKLWFTAKRRFSDDDSVAVVRLGTANTSLSGVTVVDSNAGTAQIVFPSGVLALVTDEALVYDVQMKRAVDGEVFTVQKGILRLTGQVTQAT